MDDSVVYVAHHTAMPVLAPAACQDWRHQLHLYHQQGDTVRAMFLWASAIEVQHFPPPPGQRGGLPPVRAVPPGSTVSGAIRGWAGSPFLLLAPSPSGMSLYELAIAWLKPGKLTIGARNASAFWTLGMSAPGSWSSTFCRFMHAVLWTRSPPRTTRAVRNRRTSGSPGGTGIRGAGSGGNPPLRQCLPGSKGANPARHVEDAPCDSGLAQWRPDTPSCPAHVRAVDAPVCSVATHAAGPHVVTAKGRASTASWFELGGAVRAC